jgi:ketol-acid reductoisomerase
MTTEKVRLSGDCDRSLLSERSVAVVGYGSQGRAFWLNLRDSGISVCTVLREGSQSRESAAADEMRIASLPEVTNSDIVVLAFPDHEQPEFCDRYFSHPATRSQTLVFLAGINLYFANTEIASAHDVIMIAPHGPGVDLRERYVTGEGLSCFLAVEQDSSGEAKPIGLALADALGCSKAGIYESTARDEAIGDLFGEQALLVGGLAGMTMAVFDKLVEQGLGHRNAYLETVAQLKLLVTLLEKHGPVGMIERVSRTAQVGSLMSMLLLFNRDFDQRLQQLYEFVAGGEFNKFLQNEAGDGFRKTNEMLSQLSDDPCQRTVEKIRDEESARD